MTLVMYGFNENVEHAAKPFFSVNRSIGRVILEHKHLYRVWTESGEVLADVSGRFRYEASNRTEYPAVGDWVMLDIRASEMKGTIHQVVPRYSCFLRKAAGNTEEDQVVASNVDTAFLVAALNGDFNIRRLERYLTLTWESGAQPVIVLTKTDLCSDVCERVREVESVAPLVPIIPVSIPTSQGVDVLYGHVKPGKTIVLLGSSGAGKSTISNFLAGDELQKTSEIRESDGRGRHTTTHRELHVLPAGGILIDTPGMRELQLTDAGSGLQEAFDDIEQLAANCFYRDCTHVTEPKCAVQQAVQDGSLSPARLRSYFKLQREIASRIRRDQVKSRRSTKLASKK